MLSQLFSDNVEALKLLTEAPEVFELGSGVLRKLLKINCEIGSRYRF